MGFWQGHVLAASACLGFAWMIYIFGSQLLHTLHVKHSPQEFSKGRNLPKNHCFTHSFAWDTHFIESWDGLGWKGP